MAKYPGRAVKAAVFRAPCELYLFFEKIVYVRSRGVPLGAYLYYGFLGIALHLELNGKVNLDIVSCKHLLPRYKAIYRGPLRYAAHISRNKHMHYAKACKPLVLAPVPCLRT